MNCLQAIEPPKDDQTEDKCVIRLSTRVHWLRACGETIDGAADEESGMKEIQTNPKARDGDCRPFSPEDLEPANKLSSDAHTPVVLVGWPTIALLAHGKTVRLPDVTLMPADDLLNMAARIERGEFEGICAT